MHKTVYLFMFFFLCSVCLKAQYKEFPKLAVYFTDSKYQECIEYATKQIEKEPKELYPVLYCAKSYYELFKVADEKSKLLYLKNSLKYAGKIDKIDKKKESPVDYFEFLEELHKSTLEYAAKIYDSKDKDKSKPLFEHLVKIYADTTEQYFVFYPEQRKKTVNVVGINTSYKKVNQVDSKGLKQGFWTKVYENGNKAYEVNFKDGIPVGEYRRFHENGKMSVFMIYDDKGEWADAKIYNDKEELIAEGKYHGKLKHGHWIYYKENTKAAEDNFNEGKREGQSRIYYKNGKLCDERNYKADIENGVWRQYFPSGKLKLETRIENGKRNAVYYTYHENGEFEIKGRYKNDQMDGEWIYYDNKGKELKKINYVMGQADKQDELNEEENRIFKEMEKNKGRFLDPADFMNNPYEYLEKNGLK